MNLNPESDSAASSKPLLDEEASAILSRAVKSVPQNVWDSIAAAEQTLPQQIVPDHVYWSTGTSDVFV